MDLFVNGFDIVSRVSSVDDNCSSKKIAKLTSGEVRA